MFENSKNITFAENVVTVESALNQDSIDKINLLADELLK